MKYRKQPGDAVDYLVCVVIWTLCSVSASLCGNWLAAIAWLLGGCNIIILQYHMNLARKAIDSLMEQLRDNSER